MTPPANAIREEVWELIDAQIKTFGQPSCLTPSELIEFSYRAERISSLVKSLIGSAEQLLGKGDWGARLSFAGLRLPDA